MWTCPRCGAPFAAPNASHSCVRVSLDDHFTTSIPAVRAAFDRLVALATADPDVAVVPQKTRIVFAAPMRFLAVQVRRERLVGHIFLERAASHRVVSEIVPDAYGSGLFMHRLAIHGPDDLDEAFAGLVREASARIGRRERLASRSR